MSGTNRWNWLATLIHWWNMKRFERAVPVLKTYILPVLLVIFSVAVFGYYWFSEFEQALAKRDSLLLQLLGIIVGLMGSAWVGRKSAREAGREYMRAHSRAAFRQLVFLYRSFAEVARIIETPQESDSHHEYQVTLAELKGIVFGQLATADSALEQWKDIVPEDVEELYEGLSAESATEDRQ